MADCTDYPTPEDSKNLKLNAISIDEFVESNNPTFTTKDGQIKRTISGIKEIIGYLPPIPYSSGIQFLADDNTKTVIYNGTVYAPIGSYIPFTTTNWNDDSDKFFVTQGATTDYVTEYFNMQNGAIDVSDLSDTENNRGYIYGLNSDVFIRKGAQIRVDLTPTDDVTIFKGEGKVLTKDIWGNEHVFDVYKANNGSDFTTTGLLYMSSKNAEGINVGALGDSITDGADSSAWVPNPTASNGQLNSTNYNHNSNGGREAWFSYFIANLNRLATSSVINGCNISSSGKRIMDDWAYVNFDFGFFQNAAYGNRAPEVLYISMGVNDNSSLSSIYDFERYLFKYEQLIKKAWGYGCAVSLVSVTSIDKTVRDLEAGIKRKIEQKFKTVLFHDLGKYLNEYRKNTPTTVELWQDSPNSYDLTHPRTVGHAFLGGAMTRDVYSVSIPTAKDMGMINPVDNTDQVSYGFPSRNYYIATPSSIEDSGTGYLSEFGALQTINPASENCTTDYFVWCDSNEIDAILIEPKQPLYTDSRRSNSVIKKAHSDFYSQGNASYPMASTGIASFDEYLSTNISKLTYGLNIISITYDGAPSKYYLPWVLFRKSCGLTSIPMIDVTLGSQVETTITGNGDRKGILNSGYTASYPSDRLPDAYRGQNYPTIKSMVINNPDGTGIILSAKKDINIGVKIIKTSSTLLSVVDYNDSPIGVFNGDFSGDYTIRHTPSPSGSTLYAVDSSGVQSTIGMSKYAGGEILLTNQTQITQRMIIKGGFIQIIN